MMSMRPHWWRRSCIDNASCLIRHDDGHDGQVSGLLAPIGDTRRLAEVGDWIIDCTTGAELIARFGNGTGSGP